MINLKLQIEDIELDTGKQVAYDLRIGVPCYTFEEAVKFVEGGLNGIDPNTIVSILKD